MTNSYRHCERLAYNTQLESPTPPCIHFGLSNETIYSDGLPRLLLAMTKNFGKRFYLYKNLNYNIYKIIIRVFTNNIASKKKIIYNLKNCNKNHISLLGVFYERIN